MEPRPGALKLLARLSALEVPVLIVSAGLSDVIEEFLRQHNALTENITVCSNRLNYGADSAPQSVAPDPPITSFTKDTAYRASSTFFRNHSQRTTLIVIGDSCSDVDAAINVGNPAPPASRGRRWIDLQGPMRSLTLLHPRTSQVPHNHSVSIGFLNGKEIHNDSAVKHLQTYDAIVLGHDGSLEPVDAVIDELANRDPTISSPRIKRMFRLVAEEQKREGVDGTHPTRVHGDRN
jgi:5'-nucleotidase